MLSGGPAKLTTAIVFVSEEKISEGTFGIVNVGSMKNLNIKCVIKRGKTLHLFDANQEANVLHRLQGSIYFPALFGVLENSLVMEYVTFGKGTKTIYKSKTENSLLLDSWVTILYMLAQVIIHMHSNGMLHNDIK